MALFQAVSVVRIVAIRHADNKLLKCKQGDLKKPSGAREKAPPALEGFYYLRGG